MFVLTITCCVAPCIVTVLPKLMVEIFSSLLFLSNNLLLLPLIYFTTMTKYNKIVSSTPFDSASRHFSVTKTEPGIFSKPMICLMLISYVTGPNPFIKVSALKELYYYPFSLSSDNFDNKTCPTNYADDYSSSTKILLYKKFQYFIHLHF